jgi:hypothetical protein
VHVIESRAGDDELRKVGMSELLNKISSYNIFNYLFPGIVFSALASWMMHRSLPQENVLTGAFLYYFVGLVVSRFGSLVIEPLLKSITFVQFVAYKEFVAASKKDEHLTVLSEVNNTYRTLCAAFTLLLFVKPYSLLVTRFPSLKEWAVTILCILLLALFLFSYRKQTEYVVKRTKANG